MKRLFLIALLFGFVVPSFADVPKLISYSGKITDKKGNLIKSDDYVMKFTLFDAATNGTQKWTETQTVTIIAGAYHVLLGSINPSLPKFDQNYWLEVEFNGKKFGRQQIVTTPYAMRAQYANESESLVTAAMNLIMPIGSIIAWHKDFEGCTPALPSTFLPCNGQVVTDTASPYHGKILPNLNGENRFLRGSGHSGDRQADEIKSHNHQVIASWPSATRTEWHVYSDWTDPNQGPVPEVSPGQGPSVTNTGGSETRPINMSVVWIMRIK